MVDTVETQVPMNFSSLKTDLKEIFDRGGDSSMSDRLAGRYINAAEVHIVNYIGSMKCLENEDTITTTASSGSLTFPVNVEEVISIRDTSNKRPLAWVEKEEWNRYIVDPTNSSGSPYAWTQFGYDRRTNAESPSAETGGIKVTLWPTPSTAMSLAYDCILKPGYMIEESDQPVLPMDYHYGILQIGLMLAGPYDVGNRTFETHSRMAMQWLDGMRRKERRDLSGNLKFQGREVANRMSRGRVVPLTRNAQLFGR